MEDTIDISSLKGDPQNPRRISKERFAKLQDALKQFGDLSGIVKNLETGELVGGHMRVEAFKADPNSGANIQITQRFEQPTQAGTVALGHVVVNHEPYAYREVRWTRPMQRAANLAANHAGGEDDRDLLAQVLYELSQEDNAEELLALTNIDDDDLSKLLDSVGAMGEGEAEDEAPEVDNQNPPVSKLGEIYQLGNHRLMCGDSTDFGAVSDLMNGEIAELLFTDPPYNTGMQQGRTASEWGIIENDAMSPEKFAGFIKEVLQNAYTFASGAKYVCIDWRGFAPVYQLMPNVSTTIVWVKNQFGLGSGYRPQHELILFDGKLEANDQSNVWDIKKDAVGSYEHPTQKPVAIPERAILNSSKRGDGVLDLFGGSGSTLMACEKNARISYTMELDPKYCDVIRKRYAKHIGQEEQWQEATPIIQAAPESNDAQEANKEEYLAA